MTMRDPKLLGKVIRNSTGSRMQSIKQPLIEFSRMLQNVSPDEVAHYTDAELLTCLQPYKDVPIVNELVKRLRLLAKYEDQAREDGYSSEHQLPLFPEK